MPGSLRSAGSGLRTWMLSNVTSTAWISQHQRKGRRGEDDAAQNANFTKEKRNENQTHQSTRRRVHDAAHRRDRVDHCDAERHLRQPRSAHPAGTLLRAAVQQDGSSVGANGRGLNGRRLYRLKPEPLQEVDAWLAPFRRFWSAHVDALKRHLDRMDQSTRTKRKTRRRR